MRKHEKTFFVIGWALVIIACIPVLISAIKKQVNGDYGLSGYNYKFQPLHPLLQIITLFSLILILLIYFIKSLREKSKNKK